jgi:Fe-S-cluster containining protein
MADHRTSEIMPLLDHTIAINYSGKCAFLNEEYRCDIYHERPDVCRKFGRGEDILLQCPHLKRLDSQR